jgi:DNA invertase Pin-like site-specific DNA recombinase
MPLRPRVAHYVNMSTEHQQYSPENQVDIIRQYAKDHNMEIVQVYSDHGRSGLNIASRESLNRLMADVEAKRTDFTSLLVYDVSRWGRFQDADESAYYEYVLKRAGIRVHYCAVQFENDGSLYTANAEVRFAADNVSTRIACSTAARPPIPSITHAIKMIPASKQRRTETT